MPLMVTIQPWSLTMMQTSATMSFEPGSTKMKRIKSERPTYPLHHGSLLQFDFTTHPYHFNTGQMFSYVLVQYLNGRSSTKNKIHQYITCYLLYQFLGCYCPCMDFLAIFRHCEPASTAIIQQCLTRVDIEAAYQATRGSAILNSNKSFLVLNNQYHSPSSFYCLEWDSNHHSQNAMIN